MHEKTEQFFAPVMRAIACTPNLNPDDSQYESAVVARAGQIRSLMAACEDTPPSRAQMEDGLRLLAGILRAKHTAADELAERLRCAVVVPELEPVVASLLATPADEVR